MHSYFIDSRAVLFLTLVAVMMILVSSGCISTDPNVSTDVTKSTPASPNAPKTSAPMPPVAFGHNNAAMKNQSFTLMDDRQMHLTQYLGQVVVLDFWATYCAPCVKEAPRLDSLQKELGPQGLQVIGLNVGGDDDKPNIAKFVKENSIGYTLAYPDQEMVNFYMADDDRIPQTFVFNRHGRMVSHFVGFDEETDAEMEKTIMASINERAN
jgi:thiol-disulfide isomerase/thioredoxin